MKRLLNTAYPVRFWLIGILWASFFMMVVFLTTLDDTVDVNNINATYTDGILHLTLGKNERAKKVARKIDIK